MRAKNPPPTLQEPQVTSHLGPLAQSSAPPPPPPPPAIVSVDYVQYFDDDLLLWLFTSAITEIAANCPQLLASGPGGGGGSGGPVFIEIFDASILLAHYPGPWFSGPATWQVAAEPVGLSFADGSLIVPESGIVIT